MRDKNRSDQIRLCGKFVESTRFKMGCTRASFIVSVACIVLAMNVLDHLAPASSAGRAGEVCLLDQALETIAAQRGDLSIRPDLSTNPFASSRFRVWMENPLKAPVLNTETGIQKRSSNIRVPGYIPEMEVPPRAGFQEIFGFGKTPLALTMGLLHSGGDLIFPTLFQSSMVHEKSGICFDPTFSIKAQIPP